MHGCILNKKSNLLFSSEPIKANINSVSVLCVWGSYWKGEEPLGEGAEAAERAAAHCSLSPKHKEKMNDYVDSKVNFYSVLIGFGQTISSGQMKRDLEAAVSTSPSKG